MSTPANDFFTTDVTRNTTTAADVTDNLAAVNVTARKNVTSQPNRTQPGATSAPPTYTEHHPTGNSSDRQINQTLTSSTSPFTEKVPYSDPSAGYTTVPFSSTQGARNQSEPQVITSTSLEWSTQVGFTRDSAVNKGPDLGKK